MAGNFRRFPNAVHGLSGLGGPRLTALAKATNVSLRGVVNAPGAVAGALRDKLATPELLRPHLSAVDYDVMGERLHLGRRSDWKNPARGFEDAVFGKLFAEDAPARPDAPTLKSSLRDASTAEAWPELHGIEQWVCLDDARRHRVSVALAKSLGSKIEVLEPTRINVFPRLKDTSTGRVWVAIVGDSFEMGLGTSDKQALTRMTKGWSDEAKMHVRDLASVARPAHKVFVPPLLCAETPVQASDANDTTGVTTLGEVSLFEPTAAIAHATRVGARLLTEAEWEYIAREGGTRSWLSMGDDARKHNPEQFVRNALVTGIDGEPRGVFGICGMGWGTWVEDGWHATYEGAPDDGRAWDPAAIPTVVRGGAYLSWPWQIDGEALLMHAAHRERKPKGNFPLLLACNLPARRMM